MTADPIRASGGLVFRPSRDGFEVLLVHRPRYDDWSLPKGKDEPGERPEQAAIREVEEETGVPVRIVAPLGETAYRMPSGSPKVVSYYAMRPVGPGSFTPNQEVDRIRWVPQAEAASTLTYARDADLVERTDLEALSRTGRAFVIRHASAGDRSRWEGDDRLRPVTVRGRRQAEALASSLHGEGIERILSSVYLRCRQTVEPLARRLGLEVEDHPALVEGADWSDVLSVVEETAGHNPVLCSHGDVIPDLIRGLARRGVELRSPGGDLVCGKGSIWVLTLEAGAVTSASYRPPPAA